MKLLAIKKFGLALLLLAAGLLSQNVSAQSYTYNLTYSNGGTGTITFNSLSFARATNLSALPSYVTGISLTLGGTTYTNLSGIGGMYLANGANPNVTLTTTGNQKAVTITDINFFASTFGACPTGQSPYVIGGCGTTYTLLSMILGSEILVGPSAINTNQSLTNTAQVLQGTFALQNSVLANSFSYDCTVFGENDICVSGGGRNTAVQAENGLNNTSALLIAAYRALPSVRIGAYADQNVSMNNAGSTVNLGNNTPLIGLFAAWNERQDGTGSELKVSAAYGQKDTTINRQVVGYGLTASEAGSGGSSLISQGFQVTGKHGFGVMQDVVVSPYVGIRYTQNNMGGYAETSSTSVTAPLTYSALNTNATTALAGVGASYRGIPQTNLFASAGVETDTNTANGSYNATWSGTGTLSPVNFNANPVKTRATATVGATYDVVKNQRLGVTGIYRQEAYQAVSTTTVMATYTVGF